MASISDTENDSEAELCLELDDDGRVGFQGTMNYDFRSFKLISPNDKDRQCVVNDCDLAFTAAAVEETMQYSAGSTFFLRADEQPSCSLEFLAQSIFKYHTQGATYDPSKSGAEWWTQCIDDKDDIAFHWDRDYGLEDAVLLHPHLATVTYLTDNGGSTLILDTVGNDFNFETEESQPIKQCIVSKPFLGKHISFDGRLLHGAPSDIYGIEDSDDESSDGNTRVTFLVNIWLNHIPLLSERLPVELQQKMSNIMLPLTFDQELQATKESHKEEDELSDTTHMLIAEHKQFVIDIPLPDEDTVAKHLQASCSVIYDMTARPGAVTYECDVEDEESASGEEDDSEDEEEEDEEEVVQQTKKKRKM